MSFAGRIRRAPLRIVSGAFILNSGVGKWKADEETAKGVQGLAAGTYPFLAKLPPMTFIKALSVGEMGLGSALLSPFVPPVAAGAGLTAFSGSLLGMYLKTPGMTKPGKSVAPSQAGLPISKDVWMLGIGLALVLDGVFDRHGRGHHHDEKAVVVEQV